MEPRVRRVRKTSLNARPPKALTVACAVVALVLIVVLIDFFFSPPRPKSPVASQEGTTVDEVETLTNAVRHPRSHFY